MPKIVNHQQRKEQIAEAAWRVIRRDGLDGATVRRIAEETGISFGSLRHYFVTQDELLAFAMRLVSQRANHRIKNLPFSGNPRLDMEMIIAELVPLDEERRCESEVWLVFAGKAISDPAIRALSHEVHDELRAAFRQMIDSLIAGKLVRESIDAEYEAGRLHALVDGLVLHHTVYPEQLSQVQMMSIISGHLDRLFQPV